MRDESFLSMLPYFYWIIINNDFLSVAGYDVAS